MFFEKVWYNSFVRLVMLTEMIPGSSMVEQEAVNFEVAGSSPAPGAIYICENPLVWRFFVNFL